MSSVRIFSENIHWYVSTQNLLGYIVIASAQNIQTVAGGIVLYAVFVFPIFRVSISINITRSGYTGLQLLTSIIIADITSLQWRGFAVGMTSLPFIINAFIGSNVSTQVLEGAGWRWGCKSALVSNRSQVN